MNDLLSKLKQPTLWTISVQLMILYVVGVVIFFAANAVQKKAEIGMKDRIAKGEAGPSAALFLLTAVLNFLCVAGLVAVTQKTGENIRMAMVLLPLLLVVEQHFRHMRNAPQERRTQIIGVAGVLLGVGAGIAALMPHAPLK